MTGHNMSNETPLHRFACARKSEGVNIEQKNPKGAFGSACVQACVCLLKQRRNQHLINGHVEDYSFHP